MVVLNGGIMLVEDGGIREGMNIDEYLQCLKRASCPSAI